MKDIDAQTLNAKLRKQDEIREKIIDDITYTLNELSTDYLKQLYMYMLKLTGTMKGKIKWVEQKHRKKLIENTMLADLSKSLLN